MIFVLLILSPFCPFFIHRFRGCCLGSSIYVIIIGVSFFFQLLDCGCARHVGYVSVINLWLLSTSIACVQLQPPMSITRYLFRLLWVAEQQPSRYVAMQDQQASMRHGPVRNPLRSGRCCIHSRKPAADAFMPITLNREHANAHRENRLKTKKKCESFFSTDNAFNYCHRCAKYSRKHMPSCELHLCRGRRDWYECEERTSE